MIEDDPKHTAAEAIALEHRLRGRTILNEVQRLQPGDPPVSFYVRLGHQYIAQERLDTAKHCFATALLEDAKDCRAYAGLGLVFARYREHREGFRYLHRSLKLAPERWSSRPVVLSNTAVTLFGLHRYKAALACIDAAISQDPGFATPYQVRAIHYMTTDDHWQALKDLGEALILDPTHPMAIATLGELCERMKKKNRAENAAAKP
jgi:Tfp pilus assembly protein PilF